VFQLFHSGSGGAIGTHKTGSTLFSKAQQRQAFHGAYTGRFLHFDMEMEDIDETKDDSFPDAIALALNRTAWPGIFSTPAKIRYC
jgi:hypothetical protein